MIPRKLISAGKNVELAVARSCVGSLHANCITTRTGYRYRVAVDHFWKWHAPWGFPWPQHHAEVDQYLAQWIETLWSKEEQRGLASDAICGTQVLLETTSISCSLAAVWGVGEVGVAYASSCNTSHRFPGCGRQHMKQMVRRRGCDDLGRILRLPPNALDAHPYRAEYHVG